MYYHINDSINSLMVTGFTVTSIKNHFYKMNRDIGMADYEKQVKQEFHTPSLYLCFVIGA